MLFRSKQKTAYEIRRRDWSSDVCSSDLDGQLCGHALHHPGFLEEVLTAPLTGSYADLFQKLAGWNRQRAHDQLATTSIAFGTIENSAGEVPAISPSSCTSAGVDDVTFTCVVV